jgi:hypothetical protein
MSSLKHNQLIFFYFNAMKHLILTLLFACCCGLVLAQQPLDLKWDVQCHGIPAYPEKLNDIILLSDGRLAAVGETDIPGKGKDGFFALIDAQSGNVLVHQTYGAAFDDVLLSVADPGDGTFYLVGYSQTNRGREHRAWMIRVDEKGTELFSKKEENPGDSQFERIVWLDSGKGMIAGTGPSVLPGELWMLLVEGNTITPINAVGEGIVDKLVGMEKGPRCVWLCGQTKRSRISKSGDIFVYKLDEQGRVGGDSRIIPAKQQEVVGLTGTLEGELLIAGKVWNRNGDSDVWLSELKNGTKQDTVFGTNDEDFAVSLFKTPGNNKWLVVHRKESNTNAIQIYNKDFGDRNVYEIVRNSYFEPLRLFCAFQNTYLLAGNSSQGPKDHAIRLICLKDHELLAKGDAPRLENTPPVFSDENKDGMLGPNERGQITFFLKNTGDVPITEGQIKVSISMPVDGISIGKDLLYLPHLPIGTEKKFSIPVKGDNAVGHGKAEIDISVIVDGTELKHFTASIPAFEKQAVAEVAAPSESTSVSYVEPNIPASRELAANSKDVVVKAKIITSNKGLKTNDIKRYNNNGLLEDEKSEAELSNPLSLMNKQFDYTFTYTLHLSEGRNVFYMKVGDQKTDSVVFYYKPREPDLHIISIGIPYTNLKYTQKDARDFSNAMVKQKGNGFFNRVFVQTFTSRDSTTSTQISGAFEGLFNKYIEGGIKANDYVVVFISGHGVKLDEDLDLDGQLDFGIIASDYTPSRKLTTSVNYNNMMKRYISKMNCKRFLFVDACHSGGTPGAKDETDDGQLGNLLKEANAITAGAVSFMSCAPNESSYEDPEAGNGVFTEALLEALSGKKVEYTHSGDKTNVDIGFDGEGARYANDRFVSVKELKNFMDKRVPFLVKRTRPGMSQTPDIAVDKALSGLTLFKIN